MNEKMMQKQIAAAQEDAKCAWANAGILERARQAQDKTIADLRERLEAARQLACNNATGAADAVRECIGLRERLDIAERALLGHGYRKSCGIAACNCGDQWNHGGLARERLGEIDDATRDYYQNGETLLARVQRVVATSERHEAFVRSVRANLWFATAMVETENLDNAIAWIRQAITLCDAELGKEEA